MPKLRQQIAAERAAAQVQLEEAPLLITAIALPKLKESDQVNFLVELAAQKASCEKADGQKGRRRPLDDRSARARRRRRRDGSESTRETAAACAPAPTGK